MPDLRLAVPAVALWVTCGVGIAVTDPRPLVLAGLLTALSAVLLVLLSMRRVRRGRWLLTAAAFALATSTVGFAALAAHLPARFSDTLDQAAAERTRVTVLLRVESAPRRVSPGLDGTDRWSVRGTTVRAAADIDRGPRPTSPGDARAAERTRSPSVSARIPSAPPDIPMTLVTPGSRATIHALTLGATVTARATLRPTTPGDATAYLAFSIAPPAPIDPPPFWLSWTTGLRASFAAAATATPGDGGDLLPGLAIGDETAVSAGLDDAMKASSLSHLTAVSGANCALVTGLVFLLAARVGLPRRARILTAAAALVAFVLLVGPGASVLRAAVMAAVVLLGLIRGRPADGIPALSAAVIVLLVHNPWLARDYGFVLSVLATVGLLLLAGPLTTRLARWMPVSIALVIAVPLAAQLACQPVLLLLAPSIPLFGVPANILAGPAAPAATVLGCLACAALPWAPALGTALVWLAWLPSAWIAQVAQVLSTLPGATLPWPEGPIGIVLSVVGTALFLLLLARRRFPRPFAAAVVVALATGGTSYAGAVVGATAARTLGLPPDWQIAVCDVGQGDALLFRSGQSVAMIDVGREPGPARDCLDRLGVTHVDTLILTHYDTDHTGGLEGVLSRVRGALVGPPGRPQDERVRHRLLDAGVPVEQGRAGMSGRLGTLVWRLLWPPPDAATSGNDASLTLIAEDAGLRSLFLGDLGESAQNALLRTGEVGRVDVVKVAHHGSSDQSPRLYAELGARLGLLSVGADNGYGHPTQRTLDLLAEVGASVARTDHSGLLLISPTPAGPALWVERPGSASASGRPYPGYGQGETWPPEHQADPARTEAVRLERSSSPSPSHNSRGTRFARRRSCLSRARKDSSPIGPSVSSGRRCATTIRVWRSATSPRPTTRQASCSRSRAPPCSESRD